MSVVRPKFRPPEPMNMLVGHGGQSITTASEDNLDSKKDPIIDVWVALRDLYQ